MVGPQANPLYERNIVSHKPSWVCRLFGHKYQNVAWISRTDKEVSGWYVCSRCGIVEGSTTFGPYRILWETPDGSREGSAPTED